MCQKLCAIAGLHVQTEGLSLEFVWDSQGLD